jgi:uncharacterized protein (DUF58 family)
VALASLIAGVSIVLVGWGAATLLMVLGAVLTFDAINSSEQWRRSGVTLERGLPPAFALGARRKVTIGIRHRGAVPWRARFFDHADATLGTDGLPLPLTLVPATRVETEYFVVPERRGDVTFEPAHLRVRSQLGLCDLSVRLGPTETRRVYPDFAQVSRYAWLAGNRRLQEIGIKTYQQRGQGTDFKQLAEYRTGDSVRHIDWKATLRLEQPVVRQFQADRDQAVLLLIDCGRRMRSEEKHARHDGGHFDQVLNAVMLLTYVALKQGDAVGAMTCGAPGGRERLFDPRKGPHALNALMSVLYDVQPTLTHADYLAGAEELLRRHPKRALVVVITNFRDEDGTELQHALRLLRSRHLVLIASMRERVIDEMIRRPMDTADATIEVASAHLYEQSRRDAFQRLAARDLLMVDTAPERLGVELVNRYHAVKRAGVM